jgi:hypothetical protein
MSQTRLEGDNAARAQAAAYIADLAAELGRLARNHRLDTLGYLLDMARMEARNAADELFSEEPSVS